MTSATIARTDIPAVSVIMPLFNGADQVGQTIRSVLAQSFADFELIVVDDGSTDQGPEMVRTLADPRVRLIWQDSEGFGAARNWGIRESRGELVAFIEAGDEWLPEFLGSSVAWLRRHSGCALSIGGLVRKRGRNSGGAFKHQEVMEGPWRLPHRLSRGEMKDILSLFEPSAIVCRKELLIRYRGFYRDRCSFGEDTYLWLQIALNHHVYFSINPLVHIGENRGPVAGGNWSWAEPLLTAAQPLRDCCQPAYLPLLEEWLAECAAFAVRSLNRCGNFDKARKIAREFNCCEWRTHERLRRFLDMSQGRLFLLAPAAGNYFGLAVRKLLGGLQLGKPASANLIRGL
jgi:hypothetical protein